MDPLTQLLSFVTADVATRLGLPIAVIGLGIALRTVYLAELPVRFAKRIEKDADRRFGFSCVNEDECAHSLSFYVEPDCTALDPAAEDDLRATVPTRQRSSEAFTAILSPLSKYRHVIVLADSGMGKTSLLYNILHENLKVRKQHRRRITYIPLSRSDADQRIAAIDDKPATILLLDAFDEDSRAEEDHRARLQQLLEAAGEFHRVIITSRTQYFRTDEEIPRETGVLKISPRSAGDSGELLLYKLYLAPFTAKQISKWIRRRFPIYRAIARARSKQLVRAIPELSARPMLLALVPDLIRDGADAKNLFELYLYMIFKWTVRESHWIPPETLLNFSYSVAFDLYANRQTRKTERMSLRELERHMERYPSVEQWKWRSRSLLNRDNEGHYKFAHRSILEFLYIAAFLRGASICADFEWTDFMVAVFWQAVDSVAQGRRQIPGLAQRLERQDLWKSGAIRTGQKNSNLATWLELPHSTSGGKDELYTALFIRVTWIRGSLYIFDLLRDRVMLIPVTATAGKIEEHTSCSQAQLPSQVSMFQSGRRLGLDGWDLPESVEVERLFSRAHVRSLFFPHGIRVWARSLSRPRGYAVVSIVDAPPHFTVSEIPTWDDRVRKDPQRTQRELAACPVLAASIDADFFLSRLRKTWT